MGSKFDQVTFLTALRGVMALICYKFSVNRKRREKRKRKEEERRDKREERREKRKR